MEKGAWRLIAELQKIPVAFETYYHETQKVFELLGGKVEGASITIAMEQAEERSRLLFADRYWSFEEHSSDNYCYLRRTPVPVTSLDDFLKSQTEVLTHLPEHHREQGVVVDMREAPQRNDLAFEKAMTGFRYELARAFSRITVLLESTSGLLQVNRIERNDACPKVEVFATTNEYAAVKFASIPYEAPHIGTN